MPVHSTYIFLLNKNSKTLALMKVRLPSFHIGVVKTGGIVTLAFRCVTRPGYDAVPIRFAYTIKLELIDNVLRDGDFVLYDKIEEINQTEAIGNVITDIDIEL